jgi:hypothetical protein
MSKSVRIVYIHIYLKKNDHFYIKIQKYEQFNKNVIINN